MKKTTSVFCVLITLFGVSSCGVVETEKVQVVDLEEKALQVITGGSFKYSEKSQTKNVLEAGRLERWDSDGASSEVWPGRDLWKNPTIL